MRLVILSDTHGLHGLIENVPDGDVLIHAGDMSLRGTLEEVEGFLSWFAALPHPHKLLVAGNHDWIFERRPTVAKGLIPKGVTYLQDAGVSIAGINFWGSPWQPWFYDWAFNLHRGAEIAAKWALIPSDTHVLITHGPPKGILDEVVTPPGKHDGCEALRERISSLPALRLHAFGHIHEAYGTFSDGRTQFVNASICDFQYASVNAPVVVDLELTSQLRIASLTQRHREAPSPRDQSLLETIEDNQANAVTPTSHRLIRMLSQDGRRSAAPKGVREPDVRVCSAQEAARLRPSSRAVVIAIRDPGAPLVKLRSGWRAVLSLEVPDVDPSGELTPAVDLSGAGEAIVEFLTTNRSASGIVLHCQLGVSRSRSVAAAICEAFGWPYQWTVLHDPLYRSVLDASHRLLSADRKPS